MKKNCLLIVLFLLFLPFHSLANADKLTIVSGGWPGMICNNELCQYKRAIIEAFNASGVKVDWKIVSWRRAYDDIQNQRYDAIAGINEKKVKNFRLHESIGVRLAIYTINMKSNRKREKTGILYEYDFLKQIYKNKTFVKVNDIIKGFLMVGNGKIDTLILNGIQLRNLEQTKYFDKNNLEINQVSTSKTYYLAFWNRDFYNDKIDIIVNSNSFKSRIKQFNIVLLWCWPPC